VRQEHYRTQQLLLVKEPLNHSYNVVEDKSVARTRGALAAALPAELPGGLGCGVVAGGAKAGGGSSSDEWAAAADRAGAGGDP
jgi:hypothetical protein